MSRHVSLEEFCERTGACTDDAQEWLLERFDRPMTEAEISASDMEDQWLRRWRSGSGSGSGSGDGSGSGY